MKEEEKVKTKKEEQPISLPKDAAVLGPGYDWWLNEKDDEYDQKYREKL